MICEIFRLVIAVASESESHVEKCFVTLVNEKQDVIERKSSIDNPENTSAARQYVNPEILVRFTASRTD